jgi:hypothetical protein
MRWQTKRPLARPKNASSRASSRTVPKLAKTCIDGAHEMCRPPNPFHVLRPTSPGRSVTQARGLYVSRIANFRGSDPRYGAEHRTCEAAIAPRTALMAGTPLPRARAYTVSLLCVVSTERCVTQVPHTSPSPGTAFSVQGEKSPAK